MGILGFFFEALTENKKVKSSVGSLIAEILDDIFSDPQEEFKNKLEYAKYCTSVMSLAARVDGEISEEEAEMAFLFIQRNFFESDEEDSEPFFSPDLLEEVETSMREVKKELFRVFEHPLSINDIVRFTKMHKQTDFETLFYHLACLIACADYQIHPSERKFLDKLAQSLDLLKLEKSKIEREVIAMYQ